MPEEILRLWKRACCIVCRAAQSNDIARVLNLIEKSFAQPLDVACMAQAAHLSPQHFSRKFKAALGVAPMEYLRSFRLRRARVQLLQSDDGIAHIAQSCGFEDAAYFSRVFKHQFGASPLEFRQYMRGMSK
jgi:transcriptional regulator GlxA family with amidase domain